MPEEEPQLEPNLPVQPNPAKPENEVAAPTEAEADVLDEDDDFEEFQNEVADDGQGPGYEKVEWEDNWDDEVEGENDFVKRLRSQLEKYQ